MLSHPDESWPSPSVRRERLADLPADVSPGAVIDGFAMLCVRYSVMSFSRNNTHPQQEDARARAEEQAVASAHTVLRTLEQSNVAERGLSCPLRQGAARRHLARSRGRRGHALAVSGFRRCGRGLGWALACAARSNVLGPPRFSRGKRWTCYSTSSPRNLSNTLQGLLATSTGYETTARKNYISLVGSSALEHLLLLAERATQDFVVAEHGFLPGDAYNLLVTRPLPGAKLLSNAFATQPTVFCASVAEAVQRVRRRTWRTRARTGGGRHKTRPRAGRTVRRTPASRHIPGAARI